MQTIARVQLISIGQTLDILVQEISNIVYFVINEDTSLPNKNIEPPTYFARHLET